MMWDWGCGWQRNSDQVRLRSLTAALRWLPTSPISPPPRLRVSAALPRTSATFAFNQDPARVRRADRVEDESDLQLWFGGPRSIELREDVIGLGSYGRTLTVLHGIEPRDEAEEDDEALIESWTPRLRRR
jgi:hypothetical protein